MIERRPWMLDERKFPIMVGHDGTLPLVEWRKRSEFPRSVVETKFNSFLQYESKKVRLGDGWFCFVSGVQCYFAPPRFFRPTTDEDRVHIPWAMTIDHLVSLKMSNARGVSKSPVHSLSNQTIVGYRLNKNVGHIPLPLKLLHRQVLASKDYDRQAFTWETYLTVRQHIIETERQFYFKGKFPWQPWTYDTEDDRAVADDFTATMRALEDEFLALHVSQRQQWIDEFRWKW